MASRIVEDGSRRLRKTDDSKRALYGTAIKGHHEVVRLLPVHKTEVDEEDGNEQTALHHASTNR